MHNMLAVQFLRCALLILGGFLAGIPLVAAHPPGLSSLDVVLLPQAVTVNITFAIDDIEALVPMDSDFDAEVTPAEQEASKPKIAALLAQELQLTLDGQVHTPTPGNVSFDDQNNAHITLQYAVAAMQSISVQSKLLSRLAAEHKQYATIKRDGIELGQKMLTQQDSVLTLNVTQAADATPTSGAAAFWEFVKLGVEHIVTGYDHLLFLFSLLVVTRSFWPAIKIITFFTIAHSITLALAGANIFDIPSSIIEPFIAATIMYVGAENLFRGEHPKGRSLLTFGFGLVHGFGFAGVLREMGIGAGGSGILIPLFSFNLGVEIGQLCIASVVLPLIWWLHSKPSIGKFLTPVGSSIAVLGGAYWFIERTLM